MGRKKRLVSYDTGRLATALEGGFHLRVVLVLLAVLLVVDVLGVLLGLVLGLLLVQVGEALGLKELLDLTDGEGGDGLLGESVVDGLAYYFS